MDVSVIPGISYRHSHFSIMGKGGFWFPLSSSCLLLHEKKNHAVEGEEHESTQERGELTKLGASVVACSQCWVRIDLACAGAGSRFTDTRVLIQSGLVQG